MQPGPNHEAASGADKKTSTSSLVQMTKFIVLGANGEIIGRSGVPTASEAPQTEREPAHTIEGCQVRSDWHDLICASIVDTPAKSPSRRLTNLIKTKDSRSFPGGVSKTWRRMQTENYPEGEFEAVHVAERTALSSCALER